jgi:hypothetical protein
MLPMVWRGRRRLLALAMFVLLFAACAEDEETHGDEEQVDEAHAGLMTNNGISLNGISLNGISLNGISLNGISLNGISLNGVSLDGTRLQGTKANGAPVAGDQFIGAELSGTLADGTTIKARIDDVDPSADPEILLYAVSYKVGAGWQSLCGDLYGVPIRAIPLSGRWDDSQGTPTGGDHVDDPSAFTFACVGSTLAKCTQLGYMPWKSIQECLGGECHSLPLRSFHQACTRMIRADFCGDGQPHTQNGLVINVWDRFGIQTRSPVLLGFLPEAEWSPEGAVCVANFRNDPVFDGALYVTQHCPERLLGGTICFSGLSTFYTQNGYATPLSSRSLIRNEFALHL